MAWDESAPRRQMAIDIVHYRAEHGLTEAEFAELASVPVSVIADLEADG